MIATRPSARCPLPARSAVKVTANALPDAAHGGRAVAGVLSAALLLLAGGPGAARAGEVLQGPARIIDGDTLYVQGQKIRLYAVDAPEKKQACSNSRGASYMCGDASAQALTARVGANPVRCDVRTKDQYGRYVASCTILGPGAAKEDMGQWLVSNGYAVAYRKIAPDYIPAEEKAKAQRVGIWSGSFTMPAKWRYEQRMNSFDEGDEYPSTPRAGAPPRAPVSPSSSFGGGDTSLLKAKALPTSVDWSSAGAVTPVKNQQQCGSCWAFSTTGSTEGATFIATKKLLSLSEQQLVDCSQAEGNQGCNGGLMDDGFQFIIDNKGICSEADYPYTAADGTCKKTCTPVATIKGFKDVPANSETALMTAIVQQPISVAVEADQASFQSYQSGVMDAACGTNLDHGVLAVGYGTESGKDYYKVKNSWGADWGMKGYILLARGAKFNPSGQCGIQMMPSYPTA